MFSFNLSHLQINFQLLVLFYWKRGRADDCTSLENWSIRKGTVGSNPTASEIVSSRFGSSTSKLLKTKNSPGVTPGEFLYLKKFLVSASSASTKISSWSAISHSFFIAFIAIQLSISSVFFFGRFKRKLGNSCSAFGANKPQSGNVKHLPLRALTFILISHLKYVTSLSSFTSPQLYAQAGSVFGDILL